MKRTIYCSNERSFDFILALCYPYIIKVYTRDDDILAVNSYIKILFNNKSIVIKKYHPDYNINDTDLIILSDSEILNNKLHQYKKFKNENIIGIFTEGESYEWEGKRISNFLKQGSKILTSTLISKKFESPEYITSIFSNKNLFSHTSLGFFSFISRNEIKYLSHLNELNFETLPQYDIGIYPRYGYKRWRDLFTDFLRDYSDKLSIKEVDINSNRKGKVLEYNDFESIRRYTLLKFRNHSFLHFLYPIDMKDCKLNIVYETSMEVNTIFMTEKIFKEYLFGFLPYIICADTIRDELKNIGFFSLDMLELDFKPDLTKYQDTISYVKNEGDSHEFLKFSKFIQFLSSLSKEELNKFIEDNRKKSKKNKELVENILYKDNKYRKNILNFIL